MTEKRFTFGGTDEEPLVRDNITGKEYPTEENSLMELLNELNDENQFIKHVINEALSTERTELGKSVLKQLKQQIEVR